MWKTMFFFCLLFIIKVSAQPYFSKSYDFDLSNDSGRDIFLLNDTYLIAGNTICQNGNSQCVGLMRIDFEGNLIWKDVVDSLRVTQVGNVVIDNQFIYLSTYKRNTWEDKNIRLLKFDFDGNLTGYKLTGAGIENERPMSLNWHGDRLLAAFDERIPNGNITTVTTNMAYYSKTFDSLITFELVHDPYGGNSLGFLPADDGNLFHLRTVNQVFTYQEAHVLKIDTLGEIFWEKTVGKCDYPPSSNMALLPDDEVVVRWYEHIQVWSEDTFEYANIVAKYDKDGNQLWKQYLYSPYLLRKELDYIFTTQNGDIVGCGYYHFISEDLDSSFTGAWIFRMDGDGNLKWQRDIADTRYPSGQFLLIGLEMPNGDLVFGGKIGLAGPPEGSNVWLLRTDSMGCLTPGCGDFQEIVPVEEPPPAGKETDFKVSPNPFQDKILLSHISRNILPPGDYFAILYDTQGRLVLRKAFAAEESVTVFEMKDSDPGTYLMVVFRDGEVVQTIKVMKQ